MSGTQPEPAGSTGTGTSSSSPIVDVSGAFGGVFVGAYISLA